jgi:hypothetical protein
MRFSMSRAGLFVMGAAIALAACSSHGLMPSSSNLAPTSFDAMHPHASPTPCAESPPQYDWIFKGSCDEFTLKSTGGSFTLVTYDNVALSGSIGKNTAKGSVSVVLADALDKSGDIVKYKGETFPAYKAKGTTVLYAAADNQSTQTIKPVVVKDKTILEYVLTDKKGFPGKTCAAAVLGQTKKGFAWTSFPETFNVKNDSVTIDVYEAPSGFELPPKGYGLYFAVNCY